MFDGFRGVYLRRRADWLDRQGNRQEALAAYLEAGAVWQHRDRVLAADCWVSAARLAALMEDRAAQLDHCRQALDVLPPPALWRSPMTVATGFEAMAIGADALHWLDRLAEAEVLARAAIEVAERTDKVVWQAMSYAALGQTLLRQGRPTETLGCQSRVLELMRSTGDPIWISVALADLATALCGLEQFDQALRSVTEGLSMMDQIADPDIADKQRIGALATLASIRRSTGDLAGAIESAGRSMELCLRYQRHEQYRQARVAWALCHVQGGDVSVGIAALTEVFDSIAATGPEHLAGRAATNLAMAFAKTGALDEAQRWAQRAVDLQQSGDVSARGTARFNLASLAMARGELIAAETGLLAAIDDWETVRRTVTDDRHHVDVLERQAGAYRTLQSCRLTAGDPDGAFEASERARGRSLLRLLRREQQPTPITPTVADAVALAGTHGVGFLICSLVPQAWEPLARPGDDEAGLHLWFIDAFGATHTAVDLHLLRALASSTAATRPEPDPYLGLTRDLVVRRPRAVRDLDELSRLLVQPLDAALMGSPAQRLIVVPDGELDLVPFAALQLRPGVHLGDRWPVAIVPAVAVFTELANRSARATAIGDLLLVGNPAPPRHPLGPGLPLPELPPLVHAEREVLGIAAECRSAPPLLGAAATKAAVLARIGSCEIVHFATHGLQGASEGTTPGALCLSPDGDDDGYLRTAEIAGLRLPHCRIAVLSACRTGWGRSTYEGTLGLARAFLTAGAAAVVVSLWPVDDAATADLMIGVYVQLRRGLPIGEALRMSMRARRESGAPVAEWAPFTIVGDPGARLSAQSA